MATVIDFHVQVIPDAVEKYVPRVIQGPVTRLKDQARQFFRPFSKVVHQAQPRLRYLPSPIRRRIDQLTGIAPIPGLLLESTAKDLERSMSEARITYALVVAHPPFASNEFVMKVAHKNPRFLPVVYAPVRAARPAATLKSLVKKGARAIKIHPAADGLDAASPKYRAILETISQLGVPVILHTGVHESRLLYKNPSLGNVERFAPWFKTYSHVKFVLANMNFHEPDIAIDLAAENPNVYLATSWQPAEIIGEAARRIGADRILFASDWPYVGGNLSVGLNRVEDCIDMGLINREQARMILGGNAAMILKLDGSAGSVEKGTD